MWGACEHGKCQSTQPCAPPLDPCYVAAGLDTSSRAIAEGVKSSNTWVCQSAGHAYSVQNDLAVQGARSTRTSTVFAKSSITSASVVPLTMM